MPPTPTLLGVPWDANSSYLRGAAAAPPLIRRALESPSSNRFSESLVDLEAALADAGDLDLSGEAPREAIERGARGVIARGARPLALGGDHSITYPLLRTVRPSHPRLTILHVDAHADLYEEFEGDRYSHACPFARIMEEGLADRLVQVGIRTLNPHQRAQADRYSVEVIDMRAWSAGSLRRKGVGFRSRHGRAQGLRGCNAREAAPLLDPSDRRARLLKRSMANLYDDIYFATPGPACCPFRRNYLPHPSRRP